MNYRKAILWLVAAWFAIVCCLSGLQFYRNISNRPGIAVAISALAPIAAFILWYTLSAGFRRFVLSLNARTLTYIQSSRLAGILFVILQTRGILPAIFALPAGFGDMAIGATALAVARLAGPKHRYKFMLWQLLGMADLFVAVGLGVASRIFSGEGSSMTPMTVLPLSLIPTFIVPLFFVFHLICIAQAIAWKTQSSMADKYDLESELRSQPLAQQTWR